MESKIIINEDLTLNIDFKEQYNIVELNVLLQQITKIVKIADVDLNTIEKKINKNRRFNPTNEILSFMITERNKGTTFKKIAEQVTEKFNTSCSMYQIRDRFKQMDKIKNEKRKNKNNL